MVSVLQNSFIHLEEESDYMKKMHPISDLFGPFMSKVFSLMSLQNLSPSVFTRKKLCRYGSMKGEYPLHRLRGQILTEGIDRISTQAH